jgi:hypothetical protein
MNMSSERIKETKERILTWLKEEAFSPEEKVDPQAYFNISSKIGNLGCNISQDVQHIDSFFVAANIVLLEEQLVLLREMDDKKRKEFFWDLRMSLLRNNEIGDFQIKPNPPEDTQAVFISSKRVYYDDLTKGRLIDAIHVVLRACIMVVWMLQQYAGITTPKKDQKTPYSV